MSSPPFQIHRSFRAPVAGVWPHLTRPDLLSGWLGAADLELAPGGVARIQAWNGDEWTGRVVRASPPATLAMALHRFGFAGEHPVTWALEGDGPGSRLTVTHANLPAAEERSHARAFWREALEALRGAADRGERRPEWGGTIPVVIRAPLGRPAAELWTLFATPSGLQKWVARVERFDGMAGGEFRFLSSYLGREVIEEGRIEELIHESRMRLAWEWRGEGWGAPTSVEFALEPQPGGATLLLVHSGFDRIAPEKAAAARRNYASGWAGVVRDLERLLAPAPLR
jgi:uncharacterized protein YndB with AHSA1/START domain